MSLSFTPLLYGGFRVRHVLRHKEGYGPVMSVPMPVERPVLRPVFRTVMRRGRGRRLMTRRMRVVSSGEHCDTRAAKECHSCQHHEDFPVSKSFHKLRFLGLLYVLF